MKATTSFSWPYRALAVLLCFLMVPLPALPQGTSSSRANQEAGQISKLIPAGFHNSQPAHEKDDLYWNDLLKTDKSGRMRANLRDGSILSLGSDTEMKVVQHDATSQQTQLELNYGKMRSRVVAITKPGGKFEVKTPKAVAGVIGTDWYIQVNPDGSVTIIVYSGSVKVVLPDGTVITVNAGQMLTINSDGTYTLGPTPPDRQQQSIIDTNVEGGGNETGGGSNLLRNVLITLGVAAVGSVIVILTSGKGGGTPPPSPIPPPSPTPTPDGGVTRPH